MIRLPIGLFPNLQRRHATLLWLIALVVMCCANGVAAADDETASPQISAEELTDEHIRLAIDALVEELYERKDPEHFWDPKHWTYNPYGEESQVGGYTALCALALLYAGESYQNPQLRDAIDHLAEYGLSGTYAVSLRAHIWAHLPDRYRPKLEADLKWLLDGFSERIAGWAYEQQPNASRKDNSLRQYGTLGLWEAAKRGLECDDRYWRMLEEAIIECQLADGGWNYRAGPSPPRGSMTAAGLTVLFITQDFLHAEEAVSLQKRAESRHERAIELGMQWMAENFSPTRNPGRDADFYYYLYGIERVGLASGYRYFGEHDWFREGAAELIRRLCRYDPAANTMTVHDYVAGNDDAGTIMNHHLAFALMFLSRGRVPIAINKLQIDELAWNNRPRDVANLNRWIADTTETPLNWQIVDFDAGPEAWLDAPMLYLASNDALPWLAGQQVNPRRLARDARAFRAQQARGEVPADAEPPRPKIDELERIKRYLDLGGLLFAVNEGSNRRFADAIEDAGRYMYPQYRWRNLPADHWVYTLSPIQGRKPQFKALSNGARELIILSMQDLARMFQSRKIGDPAHKQAAGNAYLYASEMNLAKPRLDALKESTASAGEGARSIPVVRAIHSDNWNPEPLALQQFSDHLQRTHGITLDIRRSALQSIHTLDPPPALVVVNGIDLHAFTADEQRAIEAYARSGGTILFETPGGLGSFTKSAEGICSDLFGTPPVSLQRHPLITGEGIDRGIDSTRVEYRSFAFETFGSREVTPRLRAIMVEDEPRIIFSRDDISHALLDQPCWGVSGYTPESARDLMTNIMLHAAQRNAVRE